MEAVGNGTEESESDESDVGNGTEESESCSFVSMSSLEMSSLPVIAPKALLSRTGKALLATLSVMVVAALLFQIHVGLPAMRGMPEHALAMVKQGSAKPGLAEKILATASRRLHEEEICHCSLPEGTLQHTLITKDDAKIPAQNMYSRVTVGGSTFDGAPGTFKAVDGKVTVGGTAATEMWNFNGGLATGVPFSSEFRWSDFEMLALSLLPGDYEGGFRVIVMETGGTFTQADFGDLYAQAEDNGHTLVIFKTEDSIVLDRSEDGRQFGPSVLAPFSKVTLLRRAGFIDGFLVARELGAAEVEEEEEDIHLQMHGEGYTGPLECPCSYEGLFPNLFRFFRELLRP